MYTSEEEEYRPVANYMKKIKLIIWLVLIFPVLPACNARQNNPAAIPEQIDTIISIGPSNTEILTALGFGDKIIAADTFSENVEGIQAGISIYDMMYLDMEHIINMQPDVVFVTGMTWVDGDEEPLRMVSNAGIAVIYLPMSTSITDIIEDIHFIAAVLGAESAGEAIVSAMENEINYFRQIAETITNKRRVYFEISPAPYMYSFGRGTFLHEMIELAGGQNIFSDRDGWLGLADEILLSANPDVILTTVNFIDDPTGEIMSRPGWNAISAVQNGDVFYIDADSSSRPSHHIIRALREIANALYPELHR